MIELKRPHIKLLPSYLSFVKEMELNGEKIWEGFLPLENETEEQFVERLLSCETHPKPGLVEDTIYWATEADLVVGRIALRHRLSENLKEFGGHIGYEVRPSVRKKGIAKEMLRLVLETPKAQELGQLLLTCAPDNMGSNKTILANGGVLTKTAYVEKWQRETNYYWIDLKLK